ncbi:MAG: hypothetical protein CM1200mP20_13890 [Pseudomonadota bacterium]|nr:MAG: hypothetical protein CM1200mP20_13890 [Pseudomonadota bacterium]
MGDHVSGHRVSARELGPGGDHLRSDGRRCRDTAGGFALLEDFGSALRVAPWGRIFILGMVGVALSTFLFPWGIQRSSAVAGALIAATGPILAALITGLIYAQPLQKGIVVGIPLAVTGGVCAVLANGGTSINSRAARLSC